MNAVDYLKAKGRMTGNCHILCRDCPLDNCSKLEIDYPEQAVEIVEKWAKENPVKTYLSVLLEKLPNMPLNKEGIPKFCPTAIWGDTYCVRTFNGDISICVECWNREYKEVE